jgi:predicted neuraminidase
LFLKRSYDEGRRWSDLELIDCPPGILGKNKPLIEDSLCILPVEYEVPWSACFLRTRDGGRTWEVCGDLGREAGAHLIQPAIVRLPDTRLAAFMRSQEDWIFVSFSDDDGESWSRARATRIPNNNSGIDVSVLRSGRLVLVCNPVASRDGPEKLDPGWPLTMPVSFDRWGERTPLVVFVSEDGGMTWHQALRLEEGSGVYSYPAIVAGTDGAIHITYTHERTSIKHVELDEEELVAGIEAASEEVTP